MRWMTWRAISARPCAILASDVPPHFPHFHGTFSLDPRVTSSGPLSGCAHSPSRSSRPVAPHHTWRLLAAVGSGTTLPRGRPIGRHTGHPPLPLGFVCPGALIVSLLRPLRSTSSRPFFPHHAWRLLVAVTTLPAHAGHPVPLGLVFFLREGRGAHRWSALTSCAWPSAPSPRTLGTRGHES